MRVLKPVFSNSHQVKLAIDNNNVYFVNDHLSDKERGEERQTKRTNNKEKGKQRENNNYLLFGT